MSQDPDGTSVRRRVTVTTVRRRSLALVAPRQVSPSVRVPCRACGCEVDAVTPEAASEILRADAFRLERLVAAGLVHGIATASGAVWICLTSLFPEAGP